jgi:peptide/nickel transport system substrate-binding protein
MPGQITFKEFSDVTTAANLLATGAADIGLVTGPDVQRLLGTKSLQNLAGSPNSVYPLAFNEQPGHVTADPQVRLALMTAISTSDFTKAAFQSYGVTSTSLYTPSMPCFDPKTADLVPKTDLAKAKQILAADGWAPGAGGKLTKNGQPLAVSFDATSALTGSGGEYIASQWNQLGVAVGFADHDFTTYQQILLKGQFDAEVSDYAGLRPTPDYYAAYSSGDVPPKGLNLDYSNNPAATQYRTAAESTSGQASCAQWAKFQESLLTNRDILPLGAAKYEWFARDVTFGNFVPDQLNVVWLRVSPIS